MQEPKVGRRGPGVAGPELTRDSREGVSLILKDRVDRADAAARAQNPVEFANRRRLIAKVGDYSPGGHDIDRSVGNCSKRFGGRYNEAAAPQQPATLREFSRVTDQRRRDVHERRLERRVTTKRAECDKSITASDVGKVLPRADAGVIEHAVADVIEHTLQLASVSGIGAMACAQ
jgi:hypothetical protein